MITCPTVNKVAIRHHYDVSTLFYRLLWGPHIHHGLWLEDESPRQAQLQLTDTLARLAQIAPGDSILDVGCGMGGSSIRLAREYQCSVKGVTLSPLQRTWATWSARWAGAARDVTFDRADIESYRVSDGSIDVVWSIECTEHLFEKEAFFQRAAQWLRPGGRVAICAWLAGETEGDSAQAQQIHDVCAGFLCPSLGTQEDYVGWLQSAGLEMMESRDWTAQVQKTWEICRRRIARSRVAWIAPWMGSDTVAFLKHFDTILAAYQSGAMKYGCFVARKAG